MAQHCIQDIFAIANIAVELKAVNLKGIGWDAAWPQLAGTALYTVFWLAAGGDAICLGHGKKERRLDGVGGWAAE